jgi:hypothetical protein
MARAFEPAAGIFSGQAENAAITIKAILVATLGSQTGPGAGIQQCKAGHGRFQRQ